MTTGIVALLCIIQCLAANKVNHPGNPLTAGLTVLLLAGLSVNKEGVLNEAVQAKTLDEVDRRVNELRRQLYSRAE